MKKRLWILIVLALSLTLAGCGKVTQAEQAIDAIGNVTMDSEKDIAAAEKLFAELSERQQDRVDNSDELSDAREEYDALCAQVEQTAAAIDAIGTVTMESGQTIAGAEALYGALSEDQKALVGNAAVLSEAREEYNRMSHAVENFRAAVDAIGTVTLSSEAAIQNARDAYTPLKENSWTSFVQDAYAALIDAEDRYTYLQVESAYNTAMEHYRQQEYAQAQNLAESLILNYPDSDFVPPARSLVVECLVASAEQAYDAGDLESAFFSLSHAESVYPDVALPEAFADLKQKVDKRLAKLRPRNGKVLYNYYAQGGYSQLTIKADAVFDALVKVENLEYPEKYVTFYVRAGESVTIYLLEGEYSLKYATGQHWFGEEKLFGEDTIFTQADQKVSLLLKYEGPYVYYSTVTVTLYPVIGGDMSTHDIPPEAF